jgi:hypothetical protein
MRDLAYRGPDAGRPLVERSVSNDSFGGLGSRMSSVSDFSDAASPAPDQYDNPTRYMYSGDFVSPQTSVSDLRSQPQQEVIDISHVRVSTVTPDDRRYSAGGSHIPSSLRSGTPTPPSASSNRSRFSWGPQYGPLSPIEGSESPKTNPTGRFRSMRSNASRRLSRHRSIPEEDGMEAGLMNNANSFASGGTAYNTLHEDHEMDDIDSFGVDISSFTGPMGPKDIATAKEYQKLESSGQLTGGLGIGFTPEVTINSKDLLSVSSPVDSVSRRLSKRGSVMGRSATMRQLAQREANRRGKIVEVVVEEGADGSEEHANADIGYFAGDNAPIEFEPLSNRHSTFVPKKQTYYPQPNWKPLSMRAPYLTALVIVSISLAVGQELLLQRSLGKQKKDPKEGLYQFTSPADMPTWDYFSFKYAPTMIAVIYGILWQVADYEIKRLEPFHQLSKEGGALAAESINVDYITVLNVLRPFMAIRFKHYAVAVSSVATLCAVSLVPTLQGPSIFLEVRKGERLADPKSTKFVNVSVIWSRLLTGVLGVISILGIILLYQLQSRRSGLVGDVKGIAGIAAMATKSHVLMDFKDLDTFPPQDIHNKLKNHRYTLHNSSLAPDETTPLTTEDKDKYDKYHLSPNPHPFMLRLIAGIPFIMSMLGFMGLLPVLLFTPANIVLNKTPWLLTALAVAVKIGYQTLEQDVRMMEPFFRLSCRHAAPKILTLDYNGMAFGYMPIRAFMNGDYLVALVGFGSVLAEILTVCVTSFAGVTGKDFLPPPGNDLKGQPPPDDRENTSGEETLLSFWISLGLSIAILTYLILTSVAVYKLRRHPFMPRQPSTIASVLGFIHQSKMLYDFVAAPEDANPSTNSGNSTPPVAGINKAAPLASTAPATGSGSRTGSSSSINTLTKPRHRLGSAVFSGSNRVPNEADQAYLVQQLEKMGKTYGLGWFTGRDGETHCGIDVEELRGGYKHSAKEDARMASKPWLGNWEYL